MKKIILVAGATGNLGLRIVNSLAAKDVTVRVLVRSNTSAAKLKAFERLGVEICKVENWNIEEIKTHCIVRRCDCGRSASFYSF